MANKKKYNIPSEFSKRYSRMSAQARFRNEEWAFTVDEWYKIWCDSGVKEHMGRALHQYCMTRVDATEAWGSHNCLIVTRRMHFAKKFYESVMNYPRSDYDVNKHGVYVPPETLEKYNVK